MKTLWQLLIAFMKIGAFTFGGGYAMLPMFQKELVEKHGWVTEEDLMDYYAIAQCTPGVIAVNTSTIVGYKQKGFLGALVSTFGVIFPSFVIISIIAAVLSNFADLPAVQYAFVGIRACVCALILNAVIKLGKKAIVDSVTLVIAILVFLVMCFVNISPVILVVLAAVVGLLLKGRADAK